MKKIWVVDDQDNYRGGIKNLFEITIPNCEVEAFSSDEILYRLQLKLSGPPDLIIIDPSLNFKKTISVVDRLIEQGLKVVLLSLEIETEKTLLLLRKNIRGYLKKDMVTNELIHCIKSILSGNRYIHSSIGTLLLDEFQKNHQGNKSLITA